MTGRDALSAILVAMVDAIPDGEPLAVRARVFVDGDLIDECWLDPTVPGSVAAVARSSVRMVKIIAAYRAEGHRVEVEYWFPGHPAATSAVWFDGAEFTAGVPPIGLGRG